MSLAGIASRRRTGMPCCDFPTMLVLPSVTDDRESSDFSEYPRIRGLMHKSIADHNLMSPERNLRAVNKFFKGCTFCFDSAGLIRAVST